MNIFVDLKIAQILLIQVMKITLLVPNFLMPLTVIKNGSFAAEHTRVTQHFSNGELCMALSWVTEKETIKQYYNRSVVIFMKIICFYPSPHRRDMGSLQVN